MIFNKASHIADGITSIRIICALALLFCRELSFAFYTLYALAGLTDIFDGVVARKTDSVSEFGSQLDTIADFVLMAVCFVKLFPILHLEVWVLIWIIGIAVIKVVNIVLGFVIQKRFVAVHSLMNKLSGVLLFVLPFTIGIIDWRFSISIICVVATFAGIQERYLIIRRENV